MKVKAKARPNAKPNAKMEPMYKRISDEILQRIHTGDFVYDKPLCTEKSLCEQYNVSRITAKHAIDELENSGILYRKRGVGSFVTQMNANGNKTPFKVFALVVPFSTTKGGIFKAIEAASEVFSHNQCQLTFHIAEPNYSREIALLKMLYEQNVDGIIYYPSTSAFPMEILDLYVKRDTPVIILDKIFPDATISTIVCDDYKGGYLLTEHLVSYGHKQICYLSRFTPDELTSIHNRYAGYVDCLKENRIEYPPHFVHLDTDSQNGYQMLKHLVNNLHLEGVTAILCENDEVAFNVYMCCRSLQIRVPNDINIAGFDNIEWATTGSANITTVDQNFALIGKTIANVLLQTPYKPDRYTIPVRIIPRASTSKLITQT